MSRLEVLIATMQQEDFGLVDSMNLGCSAIIANQHDKYDVSVQERDFGRVQMITTPTRGVGLNRNIALLASTAEFLLFADDDMYYYESDLEGVCKAFDSLPQADAIIFSVDFSRNGQIFKKQHLPIGRIRTWNCLGYGAVALAVRRSAVIKKNITFHQLFGGGCIYSAGEDTLFIVDCLKNRLRIYSHNYVLGVCCRDSSSWFRGYDRKYYHDKGVWYAFAFPRIKYLLVTLFAIKMRIRYKQELSFGEILRQLYQGIRSAKKSALQ